MAGALAAGLSSGLPALLCTAGECSYDGAGNFFTQRLTVSVPVDLRGGRAVVRSPAAIKKGDVTAALVTSWKAEVRQSVEPVYTFGAAGSVGTVAGRRVYELELEGILPQEGQNPGNLAEFSLAVPGGVYTGCTWKCFTRTETAAGMTVRGQALARGRQGG